MEAKKLKLTQPPTRESAIKAILEERHIDTQFPPQVTAAAHQTPDHIQEGDLRGRTDLRDTFAFTIDGDSSKDFDDAVSWQDNGDGTVTLGVHIADVGHYVRQGDTLDMEAFERGTSVYFANQVAPMLPVELSNGICSLNPGVDRLTLSCSMVIDEVGDVVKYDLFPSVICSQARMTYSVCNRLLDERDNGDVAEQYRAVLPPLEGLAALDAKLSAKRRRRGALDLSTTERYILCDGEGKPVEVMQKGTGQSEGIIESMMLLANETVARHLAAKGLPGVYRIHEQPSLEKLTALKTVLTPLGYQMKGADHGSFQSLLRKSKGKPEEGLINLLVLRAMMKAVYAPENLGHFGLAAEHYCHFTSPIRRYPDLMINRVLHATFGGKAGPAVLKNLENSCKTAAVQSSQREIAAMTAEREIEKHYLAEYMEEHVGEDYVGTVSGVTTFGLFLALPNGVEGLLPIRALPDDYYHYDEAHMALVGERTGRRFTFGMALPVRCSAANGGLGQVDFLLLDQEGEPIPPRERKSSGGGGRPVKKGSGVQAIIKAKQKNKRYKPPQRGGKGKSG